MLVFVLNQAQKANTGKIQTPVYENVREFGIPPGFEDPRTDFGARVFLLSASLLKVVVSM